jgi:hypothetical protein
MHTCMSLQTSKRAEYGVKVLGIGLTGTFFPCGNDRTTELPSTGSIMGS